MFRTCLAFLCVPSFAFLIACQPKSSCAQTQYFEICKNQFDSAATGSKLQLDAALKMTDALYYFDLKAALKQSDIALKLAKARQNRAAQAACAIDQALITGWLEGHDAALKHFERAKRLFDRDAKPEYRIHYYSSLILYEIFRNSGNSQLSEYFRLNDIASRECTDQHLVLQQNMLAAFNRVVLGQCSLDAPEVRFSWQRIEELNQDIGLLEAKALLSVLDAWQAQAAGESEEYLEFVEQGLEYSKRSRNRLYQIFALGALAMPSIKNEEWETAKDFLAQCLILAELHHSPPIIFDCHANLAAIFVKLDQLSAAKDHINKAIGLDYFNSRTDADRHAVYQLAFDVYCQEGDTENIKKFAKLMSEPEHMRAVVESEQRNKQLISQIAKLKQHSRDAELEYRKTNVSLQEKLTTSQKRSDTQIRILSAIAIVMAIAGLITMLRIYQISLTRAKRRLSEEQESGRHVRAIQAGLELKLSRLQRMESLGLLAGGVAHDFNNLLVGVLGNAEILQMKSDGMDEFTNQRINQIIKSAEKAADLSHQMLAYAGKRQIDRCTVDLNQIVFRLESVLRSNLKPGMELEIACWSLPLACEIDETQIEQVLMNLVSNAVSASSDSGKILVRTGQEQIDDVDESLHGTRITGGQFNFIEVEDLGCGISEEDIERIFEPFFSDKNAGRGLGLAVVYGMVSGHDGLIRLDTQVGCGAKFRILLPDALHAAAGNTANQSCLSDIKNVCDKAKPTILVVDDEATVLDLTQQLLQVNGWNVLVAASGMQALEQIEDHKDQIRAILLDVVMPEFGAAELLQQLNDRQISIPVVLMSGFSHTQLHDEFSSQSHVVEILEKPFRIAQLTSAIENAAGVLPRVA